MNRKALVDALRAELRRQHGAPGLGTPYVDETSTGSLNQPPEAVCVLVDGHIDLAGLADAAVSVLMPWRPVSEAPKHRRVLAGWATGQVHVADFDGEEWRIEVAVAPGVDPPVASVDPPHGWQPLPSTGTLKVAERT